MMLILLNIRTLAHGPLTQPFFTEPTFVIFFSEVNSGFFYKTASEREKLVKAERAYTDQRVRKIIDFKKKMCDGTDKSFVVINQKVQYLIDNYIYHFSSF